MFAQDIASFVGKPFKRGGNSLDEGFDCMGLLWTAYEVLGKSIPHYWKEGGVDDTNYVEHYMRWSREEKEAILLKYADTFGEGIPVNTVIAGDFVIMKVEYSETDIDTYPGMYVGNGMVMASFVNRGVTVFPLCDTNYIIKARRV